jgi:hypothetical protein
LIHITLPLVRKKQKISEMIHTKFNYGLAEFYQRHVFGIMWNKKNAFIRMKHVITIMQMKTRDKFMSRFIWCP